MKSASLHHDGPATTSPPDTVLERAARVPTAPHGSVAALPLVGCAFGSEG